MTPADQGIFAAKQDAILMKMEREARANINTPVTIGRVTVIAQRWRSNPPSGVVTEHVRVSFKLDGKSISRAQLYANMQLCA